MKWEPQWRQVISWLWVDFTQYFHKWPRQESASGIWSNKNGIKCNSAKRKYHAWGWVARVVLTEDLDGNARLFFKSVMENPPSILGLESQSFSSSVSDQICPRYPGETYAWAAHPPHTSPGTPGKLLALPQERCFQPGRRQEIRTKREGRPSKLLLPKNTLHGRQLKPGKKEGGFELMDTPGTGTLDICPIC